MNTAAIEAAGDGTFRVTGPVVMATAGELLETSRQLFPATGDLQIDLSGVTQVDSSALALLIEWLRQARQRNHSIRIEGAPDKLLSIARLTDVQDIILNK